MNAYFSSLALNTDKLSITKTLIELGKECICTSNTQNINTNIPQMINDQSEQY